MEVVFIRHGQAKSNVGIENGVVGSDESLTAEGIDQMKDTARRMGLLAIRHEILLPSTAYHSPYKRTTESAEILAERLGLELAPEEALRELQKGDWHGRPVREIMGIEGQIDASMRPYLRPPNGENWFDVAARVTDFVAQKEADGDTSLFMVTHNHPAQMGMSALCNLPPTTWEDRPIDNASISQIYKIDGTWHINEALYNA